MLEQKGSLSIVHLPSSARAVSLFKWSEKNAVTNASGYIKRISRACTWQNSSCMRRDRASTFATANEVARQVHEHAHPRHSAEWKCRLWPSATLLFHLVFLHPPWPNTSMYHAISHGTLSSNRLLPYNCSLSDRASAACDSRKFTSWFLLLDFQGLR